MLIGYARVSTDDQDFALQEEVLSISSCKKNFYDKMSGAGAERPGLREVLEYLRDREDTLVVWLLDRLRRSLKNLLVKIANERTRYYNGARRHSVLNNQPLGEFLDRWLGDINEDRLWSEPPLRTTLKPAPIFWFWGAR